MNTTRYVGLDVHREVIETCILDAQGHRLGRPKVKTDKVDAEVLAQLLRCDYLPRVWQPDAATRRLRELSSYRAGLVANQT